MPPETHVACQIRFANGIFQVIKRLNPRIKWIIAVSMTFVISGICILTSLGVGGNYSRKSSFGTDESNSSQEELVHEARKPTYYPSAMGTKSSIGLHTHTPSFSTTSTYYLSTPKIYIKPSKNSSSSQPSRERINPSELPTYLPQYLQELKLSTNPTKLISGSPTFQPTRSKSAPIYPPDYSSVPTLSISVTTTQPFQTALSLTNLPTNLNSSKPSKPPSSSPTVQPNISTPPLTYDHDDLPSSKPADTLSIYPALQPYFPDPTYQPSNMPIILPTDVPTHNQIAQPVRSTPAATKRPSESPSSNPTAKHSTDSTIHLFPTSEPSLESSNMPSQTPTINPTFSKLTPTHSPTGNPSFEPTRQHSARNLPSIKPTTSMPSYSPILQSYAPTNSVTFRPSYEPSVMLFHNPSTAPSSWTTITPSSTPTYEPNAVLSTMPSQQPSERAIEAPLSDPTSNPTKPSSSTPTFYPTTSTSQSPTKMTDRSTTSQPTMHPHPTLSGFPSQEPEFQPHSEPQNPNPTYFNYNPASIFGPNQWGDITALNSTDNYWFEFGFVENRCNADDQSPIDVCTKPTRDCKEHHEFRTRVNDLSHRISFCHLRSVSPIGFSQLFCLHVSPLVILFDVER